MQFPLIGSCVLFGLYVVVKYVSKTYLDVLISCYFGLLGSGGVFQTIRDPVSQLLGAQSMKKFSFSLRWQFWKSKDESGAFTRCSHSLCLHQHACKASSTAFSHRFQHCHRRCTIASTHQRKHKESSTPRAYILLAQRCYFPFRLVLTTKRDDGM